MTNIQGQIFKKKCNKIVVQSSNEQPMVVPEHTISKIFSPKRSTLPTSKSFNPLC